MNPESIPGGAFSVARKLFNSKIWSKDPLYLKVWIWIVGQANHSEHTKNNHKYQRGELVTTYDEIIKNTSHTYNRRRFYLTIKKIRVILRWLESENMILVKPLKSELQPTGADTRVVTRAYVGIKIIVINYDTYQDLKSYKGRHKGRHPTSQGHNNNNVNNVKGPFVETSDEFRLSKLLFDLILKRNSNNKKPNFQKWAKQIDFMIRIDNRPVIEIECLVKWCQNDSFWQNNILSTAKLRGKYDQLLLKMKSEQKTEPEQTSPPAIKEITPENVESLYDN